MNVLRRERATIAERSLPDTKLAKYPGKLFLIGDFTGDLAEKMQGATNIQ